jgi:hypothetical protein
VRLAIVLAAGLLGASASHTFAQELTVAASVSKLTYGGDDYDATNGDRSLDVVMRYRWWRGLQVGGGAFVGKFDHPVSDPSFTSIAVFLESTWLWRPEGRVRPYAGGRVAWEHERVGELDGGLWLYGWSIGPSAGVDVVLTERVFVGMAGWWAALDLGRELTANVIEDRKGHRFSLGGTFGLRW